MINFRIKGIPRKTLARNDSFIDHLVCPETKEEKEISGRKTFKKKRQEKKARDFDKNDIDPSGWDSNSNYENDQILLKKRATTSHVQSKTKLIDVESNRAKTSHLNFRKDIPKPPQRPITSSFRRPTTSYQQRQSTPSQKARLGARCFLSAFSDPHNANKSLDMALMNLIGTKKEKYVI